MLEYVFEVNQVGRAVGVIIALGPRQYHNRLPIGQRALKM